MDYRNTSKCADKLPTHLDGQKTLKTLALMNAILLGLKNPMVYQKCLEEKPRYTYSVYGH